MGGVSPFPDTPPKPSLHRHSGTYEMKPVILVTALVLAARVADADQPDHPDIARGLHMERDEHGVLSVTINDGESAPITFTAHDHTEFVEAFFRIGRDRERTLVTLTCADDWMAQIDFASFGTLGAPDVWAQIHAEGVQVLENLADPACR